MPSWLNARTMCASTFVWFALGVVYVAYANSVQSMPSPLLDPTALGGLVAGFVSPLALAWLAFIYWRQTVALREAVTAQEKTIQLQLITGLRLRYADDLYRQQGKIIGQFKKKYPNNYWIVFRMELDKEPLSEEIDRVDAARRMFSDYCHAIQRLPRDMIEDVIDKPLVLFLKNVIWKLEFAKDRDFDKERFKNLWSVFGESPPDPPDFDAQ